MVFSLTRLALAVAFVVGLAFVVSIADTKRWRTRLERRLLYGVPWGTALTVAILVAFFLFVQRGLWNPDDPLTVAFVSWSYFYPTGMATAGIAHGSTAHLASNATATIVFGALAEYAWGHYPDGDRDRSSLRSNPWVRALVAVPLVLFAVAFLTAFFSLGPGLGFSGAVYALIGFTVVVTPRLAIGAVVATSALSVLVDAVSNPIVREGIETGAPEPPGWAGVGFHAHLLGFLVGIVLAIALLRRRDRLPRPSAVFAAVALVGLVQSVWLLVWSGGDDVYTLYRGAGVIFLIALSILVTIAVAGSERPIPRPLSVLPWAPSRRALAAAWFGVLTLVTLLFLATAIFVDGAGFVVAVLLVGYGLLVLPALPPLLPERVASGPIGRRRAAFTGLVAFTVVVALVGVPYGLTLVGDDVPGSGGVDVGDFTVTYEENATIDRTLLAFPESETETTHDGVLVVSDDRELFTVAERAERLEHDRTATVVVGGLGWYESVDVERTGWDVLGNETAYAVDLTHDGETTRSFTSEPATADATIDDHTISIVPTDESFEIRLDANGSTIGAVPVPDAGEDERIESFEFRTQSENNTVKLYATLAGTTVQLAEEAS
ncbi:rhomboid family intramembrane serine protease [Halovivax gelatinilyticus]|uniref:rhomboid family intramembrane serine protease n=1 Tax=Halovivax gelatinilyticus TaxID=2961597 RepID=UPI0020CA7A82|nr:rhomboid family intramembrane serine protease [Halovivax gelatinilyticus]